MHNRCSTQLLYSMKQKADLRLEDTFYDAFRAGYLRICYTGFESDTNMLDSFS